MRESGAAARPPAAKPRRTPWLLLALLAFPTAGCGQSSTPFEPPAADGSLRVLFIGNSLTAFNDLPGMLDSLLRAEGTEDLTIASIARPNYGLEDHWSQQVTHDVIAEGWDVVVLQQGPSATEGRPSLLEYSGIFAAAIRDAGGIPALYMVWPAEARSFDFPGVSDSYSDAADRVGGLLFPAGEAWLEAWELDPDVELYGPDRFHPGPLGTYAAALVMYEQLSGRDPRELSGGVPGYPDAASSADLDIVRRAARQANARHRRTPR
ncbi:MAG: hypothetical protein PVF05_02840 [Gemmatimonadales bacterium]